MSQQNVAVVRRWVELYNERDDVASFSPCSTPRLSCKPRVGPRLRGHDQAREWFEKPFENVRPRILTERFVVEGDTVVGLGGSEVRWIDSGEIAHKSESAAVFRFRHGKIISWQPFDTHAAALKRAGLAE